LSSWLSFELILANWGSTRRVRHGIFAILGCLILLATTSSTGCLTVVLALMFRSARLVAVCFFAISHNTSPLDAALWHKAGSASAVYRSATVRCALEVIQPTYGLGTVLRCNRAVGTLAFIGSNLGILGLVMFFYSLAPLFGETFSELRLPSANMTSHAAMTTCAAAFAATLTAMAILEGELSDTRIWVLWAMLVGSVRAQTNGAHLQPDERSAPSSFADRYPSPLVV
jgi:hypothetical protein